MTWIITLAVAAAILLVGFIIRTVLAAARQLPPLGSGSRSGTDSGLSSSSDSAAPWWPTGSGSGDGGTDCGSSSSGTSSCDSGGGDSGGGDGGGGGD